MESFTAETLARAFTEHRERLKHLAERNLNPVLLKRLSPEDVLQSAYEAAAKRLNYFAAAPEVPVYFKLRTILFQTIADLERRHLQAQGRDAYKEVEVEGQGRGGDEDGDREGPMEFPADITSPVSRVDREERHALLRKALSALAPNDRQILELRHFDDFGNADAAAILGIEPKAASIRYVRALERLQKKLLEFTCFQGAAQ